MGIDLNLSINPQAWAILNGLSHHLGDTLQHDYPNATVRTHALYNGRERGIVLTVSKVSKHPATLLVFFGEDRKSDQGFVWTTVVEGMMLDPPVTDDFSADSYSERKQFPEFRVDIAIGLVTLAIQGFLKED